MLKSIILALVVTVAVFPQSQTKHKWEHLVLLVRSDEETILTRPNLITIKQFILRTGNKLTYCNLYNNNPYFKTNNFEFHLVPDDGQANINCDTTKSDFNIINLGNLEIDFRQTYEIRIRVPYADSSLPICHFREIAERAVQEMLSHISSLRSAP